MVVGSCVQNQLLFVDETLPVQNFLIKTHKNWVSYTIKGLASVFSNFDLKLSMLMKMCYKHKFLT